MVLNEQRNEESYKLRIDNNDIATTTSIKLLCINKDDEVKFNPFLANVLSLCFQGV